MNSNPHPNPPPLRGRENPPSHLGRGLGGGQKYAPYLVQLAKNLRRTQTDAEKLMWEALRGKQLGYKFRRQQPFGKYITDFICLERNLIIELDGSQHLDSKSDITRDNYIKNEGYKILRYWNKDVLLNTEAVLQDIYNNLS